MIKTINTHSSFRVKNQLFVFLSRHDFVGKVRPACRCYMNPISLSFLIGYAAILSNVCFVGERGKNPLFSSQVKALENKSNVIFPVKTHHSPLEAISRFFVWNGVEVVISSYLGSRRFRKTRFKNILPSFLPDIWPRRSCRSAPSWTHKKSL